MSSVTHLYFDHPYESHADERGLVWATPFIDLQKVYNYMPLKLFDNLDYDKDSMSKPLERQTQCKSIKCMKLEKPHSIVGKAPIINNSFIHFTE